jgi:hypothetical protein
VSDGGYWDCGAALHGLIAESVFPGALANPWARTMDGVLFQRGSPDTATHSASGIGVSRNAVIIEPSQSPRSTSVA